MERDRRHKLASHAGRLSYACRAYMAAEDIERANATPAEASSLDDWQRTCAREAVSAAQELAALAGAPNATAKPPTPPKAVKPAQRYALAKRIDERARSVVAACHLDGATAVRLTAAEVWMWIGGLL